MSAVSNDIIKIENTIIEVESGLKRAIADVKKAKQKYEEAKHEVEKHSYALKILKNIETEEKASLAHKQISEVKANLVIHLLEERGGRASYTDIYKYLQKERPDIETSANALYAFLKLKVENDPDFNVELQDDGEFKLISKKINDEQNILTKKSNLSGKGQVKPENGAVDEI